MCFLSFVTPPVDVPLSPVSSQAFPPPMRSQQLPAELPQGLFNQRAAWVGASSPCPSAVVGLYGDQKAQVTKDEDEQRKFRGRERRVWGDIYFCSAVRLAVFPWPVTESGLKWPRSRLRALSFHRRALPSLSYRSAEGVGPRLSRAQLPFYKRPPLPYTIRDL